MTAMYKKKKFNQISTLFFIPNMFLNYSNIIMW